MQADAAPHDGITEAFIRECSTPAVQSLKPNLDAFDTVWTPENQLTLAGETDTIPRAKYIWVPTLSQLLHELKRRSKRPDEPILRPSETGWECVVTIDEWAADYETYIETQRRFSGDELIWVVLRAVKAAIGIGERWMV